VRLAYLTTYDPRDVRNWSGLGFFIAEALADAGIDVTPIGPVNGRTPTLLAKRAYRRIHRHDTYLWERSAAVNQRIAREIERRLATAKVDALLSPGSTPLAYMNLDKPVAFWTDATFRAMTGFYREYDNVDPSSAKEAETTERAAITRADLAIYASEWAARSAREDYGADPAKVQVVPFGANIGRAVPDGEVAAAISQRPSDRCRLLFVGLDWKRKGADVAVEVVRELNRSGVPTELDVAGSEFPVPEDAAAYVTFHGFIDKRAPDGRAQLDDLLARSHFLIHPARAECFGVALCEANAFGVPCLATAVGGIPTIVREGVNGYLFRPSVEPHAFVERIRESLSDLVAYRRLAEAARAEFRDRLNWGISGRRVRDLLEKLL
jgi:glycosyltransferase involved in cell wall biosynthesis